MITKPLKNTSGSLTIDFLFATVLVSGFTGILFALSFTLTIVEITQYITFASARNYVAAHIDENRQKQEAQAKFEHLTQNTFWARFYKNDGWFKIDYAGTGDFREEYTTNQPNGNDRFWGTKVELEAKMLDFNIPFFASTNTEDEKFLLNLNSFLGRQPTQMECNDFVASRLEKILALDTKYGTQIDSGENYARIYDNGC
tara:strand:+ start:5981 stop:6580 length:600 start_codon:yes stop_codon:yes gene_type:complete